MIDTIASLVFWLLLGAYIGYLHRQIRFWQRRSTEILDKWGASTAIHAAVSHFAIFDTHRELLLKLAPHMWRPDLQKVWQSALLDAVRTMQEKEPEHPLLPVFQRRLKEPDAGELPNDLH